MGSIGTVLLALLATLLAEVTGASLAHPVQMATGTYTGDGAAVPAVVMVGFHPDVLIVKGNTAQLGVMRTASAPTPIAALAITAVNGGAHPVAGVDFSVVVQARDAAGAARAVTTATLVQLSLKKGSGALGGTVTGTIAPGASQVEIRGVTYTKAEGGVVLNAARTGGDALAPGVSAAFTVDPGSIASYGVALTSPQTAGLTFGVTATAVDKFGNRVTTDSATPVTFASASSHVQFDANLDGSFGDATKMLAGGLVSVNARGTTAESTTVVVSDTNGKTGATSIAIAAGAAKMLGFATSPGPAVVGSPIPGPPTVSVQDAFGNAISSSKASISIAIATNPGGGTLAGTTKKDAANGIAVFDNLTISKPGSGYTLSATAHGLAGATSGAFVVSPPTGSIGGHITRATDGMAVASAAVTALQAGMVTATATSSTDGTYTLGGLAPGTYDVRVSAAGFQSQTRNGVAVTAGHETTINLGLVPSTAPAIRITSPAAGSVIASATVLVRGEVSGVPTGAALGVSVNDQPGLVAGSQFAAIVSVDSSVTRLATTLRDASGVLASDAIDVTISPATGEEAVRLQATPAGGSAPLAVAFSLSSSVAVSQVILSADAPGTPDFQGTTLDGVTVTYTQPGLYAPAARVTDAQGRTYSAATLLQVFDAAVLDAQLLAIWNGFKDAVRVGDLGRAGGFLHAETRSAYQTLLANLGPGTLASIDQIMTSITLVEIGFAGAQYEMLRQAPDGTLRSFAVWFQIDEDGLWRLRKF